MNYEDKWINQIPHIKAMGIQGFTLKEIGSHYNVTGAYIYKLNKLYKIFKDDDIWGASAKAKFKNDIEKQRKFLKYGNKEQTALYKAKRAKFIIKKSNMKRAGIEFTINFGDLEFPEYCPVFNTKLDYFAKGKPQDDSPSFDRIDNTKGYVKGNVIIISNKANRLKSNSNIEDLKKIINYIETFLN